MANTTPHATNEQGNAGFWAPDLAQQEEQDRAHKTPKFTPSPDLRSAEMARQRAEDAGFWAPDVEQQHAEDRMLDAFVRAHDANPDEYARMVRKAQDAGLPLEVIQQFPAEAERRARYDEARRIAERSPTLAKWLGTPGNAELASDDTENLSAIEQTLRSIGQFVGNTGSSLLSAAPLFNEGAWGVVRAGADMLPGGGPLAEYAAKEGLYSRQLVERLTPKSDNVLGASWYSGMQSLGLSGLQLPLGIGGKLSPILTSMGLTTGGQAYGQARDQGASVPQAGIYATAQGLTEAGTEMIGLPSLFRLLKPGKFGAKALEYMVREQGGEQVATAVQDLNEWAVLNPEGTFQDYLDARPNAALQTALATAFSGGGQVAVMKAAQMMADRGAARSQVAEQTSQGLQALTDLARASKLVPRNAERFAELIDEIAQDSPVQTLYVDAKALMQDGLAAQLAGVSPSIAQQMDDAFLVDGQVAIPVAEFVSRIAPTPAADKLIEHLRTAPDAMNLAEQKVYLQTDGEALRAEIEDMAARQQAQDIHDESRARVLAKVKADLNEAGRFSPTVNEAYAALTANFYNAMGQRFGMTAEQYADQHPMRIVADLPATEPGKRYEQPARAAFDPESGTIALLKSADLTSFLHESGHFYFENLANVAARDDAPADVRTDAQAVLDWLGVPDLATWQGMTLEQRRAHHEQFARGFEAYLFEGRAPSFHLQGVFARFRAWLVSVYRSLTALNVGLTDEVRRSMDRLVATSAEIEAMQASRSAAPMFATQPESMSEEEWQAYQRMGVEATDAALANYQTRRLKDIGTRMSKEGRAAYKAIRQQVADEVAAMPVYRARKYLTHGALPDGTQAGEPAKLSRQALAQQFGDAADAPWRALPTGQFGMVAAEGALPDVVAEMFRFPSGDALVRALVDAPKPEELIRHVADARFTEQYGDAFSPEQIAKAAQDELATEPRGQQLVAELTALNRAIGVQQMPYRVARQFAEKAVAGMPVERARLIQTHTHAEARAGKQAERALAEGDMRAAATAKRAQVLNHQLARASRAARMEIEDFLGRTVAMFKPDSRLGKSRDIALVNAARALLAAHGLAPRDPRAYLEPIQKNAPETWAELEPLLVSHLANPVHYSQLSMEEFRSLMDEVDSLWHLSRRSHQVMIDGQLVERAEIQQALIARLQELGQPHANLGYAEAVSDRQKATTTLLGLRAALRRVESWTDQMDGAPGGVFRSFIWQPVSEAIGRYRSAKVDYLTRYMALLDGIRPRLTAGKIAAPEIGYTFRDKAELLHAVLHTGNASNKGKLLLGRLWGEFNEDGTVSDRRWQAFLYRAAKEGTLQREDFEFAQGVWNLLDEMKPKAQEAHRDMFGFYFREVEAEPVVTPFGTFRGGYVPAITDSAIVNDAIVNQEREDALAGGNAFMFPTTGRGFTKSRVENYAKPLLLDLAYLGSHIDKVLRFTYVEPHIRDVARIVKSRSFGKQMDAFDPTVRTDMLIPWLQRAASQRVETPALGRAGRAADHFFSTLRKRTGLAFMTANVVNTLQQITGLGSAAVKVKPRHLRDALWQYVRQPKATAAEINAKSEFMRHRVASQVMEITAAIDDLALNPGKFEAVRDFAQRHGYFMQAAFQNAVDIITWAGAYDQATEGGADEAEAVRQADAAVRLTQGSFAPEDVSRFETGSPFVRAFTMFYSYFNTQANLIGSEVAVTLRDLGLKDGAGRLMFVYLMGFVVPAVMAEAIVRAMGSGFDVDGDDDVDLWDVLAVFFGAQGRFLAGMVPGVGPATIAAVNTFNSKPYDDRLSTSPAIQAVESAVRAPHSVYAAIAEDGSAKRAARDTLTLLSLATGVPVAVLGKPLGYAADVAEGRVEPTDALDAARGLVSGVASPESKR